MVYDIDEIRTMMSDETILNAFIAYMTTDQLQEFCEQLDKDYDLYDDTEEEDDDPDDDEPQDIFEMIDQYNFTFDELEHIRLMQEDEEMTDEELFDTIIEIARENELNEDKF